MSKAWQQVASDCETMYADKLEAWRDGYRAGCRAWYVNDPSAPMPYTTPGFQAAGYRQGMFDCDISCNPEHRIRRADSATGANNGS